jgi:hypothetical protein
VRRVAIAVSVLMTMSPATAMSAGAFAPLKRYVVKIDDHVRAYRGLLRRSEALLSEQPRVNVDPLVEKLNRLADSFEDLEAAWQTVEAPRRLGARHRGMGRVFVLFADAYRIHAAAVFTRKPDELAASGPKVHARLRSAAYLQKRWAAALHGALIRAGINAPKWLHGMATQGP